MPSHHSTPCPTGVLIGTASGAKLIYPSKCKRWACADCGPPKARNLARRLARTPARRLVTLTARPTPGQSPIDQLDALNAAWRIIWKRIQRAQGGKAIGYAKVVELTKQGTPHLHIVLASAFVPQRTLSRWMAELTGWSIVDIRAVKSQRGLARYLAKYLTKAGQAVPSRRKWSSTRKFVPQDEKPPLEEGELPIEWKWAPGDVDGVLATYLIDGWTIADVKYLVLQPP